MKTSKILTFYDSPEIKTGYGDKNIIYVEDFTTLDNACHMGEVKILGRSVYAAICSEGESSKISLEIETPKGIILEDFELKKASDKDGERLEIDSDIAEKETEEENIEQDRTDDNNKDLDDLDYNKLSEAIIDLIHVIKNGVAWEQISTNDKISLKSILMGESREDNILEDADINVDIILKIYDLLKTEYDI